MDGGEQRLVADAGLGPAARRGRRWRRRPPAAGARHKRRSAAGPRSGRPGPRHSGGRWSMTSPRPSPRPPAGQRAGTPDFGANSSTSMLVPPHRGFDGLKFNGGLAGPRARPGFSAARDAGGPPDEAGAFEGEHHLVHAGWRDLEVPLPVGFRGRLAEDTAVGVDEGQVLTLFVGERGSRGHVPNN